MAIKKVTSKQPIDPSKYVNIETGETLASEYPKMQSVNNSEDYVIIDSSEYCIIDSKAIEYIEKHFNESEAGRIFMMANMVKGVFNILHDKQGEPHTEKTLAERIEYTRNSFFVFMKKLHEKSVIYYIDGYLNNKRVKHIMLNPFLSRKNKMFHKSCISVFTDLSKLK